MVRGGVRQHLGEARILLLPSPLSKNLPNLATTVEHAHDEHTLWLDTIHEAVAPNEDFAELPELGIAEPVPSLTECGQ